MYKKISLFFIILLFSLQTNAQAFINEIKAFRKADSIGNIPSNPVLFIGSSSFTNWKDVGNYFPDYTILNRGFGGSSLPHLIMYADDILFKYNPKQIVIYCGENDLTGGIHITSDSVLHRFIELYSLIRTRFPKIPIAYISMKPSPSRTKLLTIMQEGNSKIQDFIEHQKRAKYINVYEPMLNLDGTMKPEIYRSDSLHMNSKGYEIWKKIIQPYLVK